ncbi:MAG: PIG-L family deacetylase [Lentisphaerae bacterium]|nr:PIG-L family deacetylase [Lentisphaerota bacterium]
MTQRRLLFIGAHPDDPDILCGGTACKWIAAGHVVKFISATNGDTGHYSLSRAETAARRKLEAEAAGRAIGLQEYQVLDHPCGLEPTLENRKEMVRLIRRFAPDVVISHRLCDYHPDHRATAQLVLDTAYIVKVPHFCEDTPIPDNLPIYAYSYDRFQDPRPHRPDAAVEIDSVLERKLDMMECHTSQYFEWLPWNDGYKDFSADKMSRAERREWLLRWVKRFEGAAEQAREWLCRAYGSERGRNIRYAETFEQSPYSRTLPRQEFQQLMEATIP